MSARHIFKEHNMDLDGATFSSLLAALGVPSSFGLAVFLLIMIFRGKLWTNSAVDLIKEVGDKWKTAYEEEHATNKMLLELLEKQQVYTKTANHVLDSLPTDDDPTHTVIPTAPLTEQEDGTNV